MPALNRHETSALHSPKSDARLHYLDTLRAVLMSLGIVIHSLQVYSSKQSWLVTSDASLVGAAFAVDFLHLFRMPAFFLIAGFFAALLIERLSLARYLLSRIGRIALPLVVAIATVNLLQHQLLESLGLLEEGAIWSERVGTYLSHLWFLFYLLLFFPLWALARRGPWGESPLIKAWLRHRMTVLVLPLLLPLVGVGTRALGSAGLPIYQEFLGVLSLDKGLYFFAFFAMGICCYYLRYWLSFLETVQIPHMVLVSVVSLAIASTSHWLEASQALSGQSLARLIDVLAIYSKGLAALVFTALAIRLSVRFGRRPLPFARRLADASYTIYLVHHLLVIVFALLIRDLPIPPLLGFLVLVSLVAATSFVIHEACIKPYSSLRFLFNGETKLVFGKFDQLTRSRRRARLGHAPG